MKQRYFDIADMPTVKNLDRLDHLSRQRRPDGEFDLIDTLLIAAIDSISLLPTAVRFHIHDSGFYTCGQHQVMSPQRRTALWDGLAARLGADLDKVLADPALQRRGRADLSDRKQTRGERIEAICDQLDEALRDGRSVDALARVLEREGQGTAAGADGKRLVRLLAKKRIPDWTKHRYEPVRLVYHARIVAHNLHHLS
jgi:hypothetical protein